MKKIIVSLLFAVIIIIGCCFALADEIQLDKSVTTGNTTVSLNVDSTADTYIFTIPAAIVIDPGTQYGYGTLTLKAGWELISVNEIDLAISNVANGVKSNTQVTNIKNRDAMNFTLKNSDGSVSVGYGIKSDKTSRPFANNGSISNPSTENYTNTLISATKADSNTEDKTCTLTFYVYELPVAGIYTDIITFAITTK